MGISTERERRVTVETPDYVRGLSGNLADNKRS